jgi:IPT/TIG domain
MRTIVALCCMAAATHYLDFASAFGVHNSTTALARAQPQFEVAQLSAAPVIRALTPDSGPVGTLIRIQGANFTSDNVIQFRGAQASFAAGSPVSSDENGTRLQFRLSNCPSYEPQCPGFYIPPGPYTVTVNNINGVSNEVGFVLVAR